MSDLYVRPGSQFTTNLSNAPTGLVGTIGVRLLDAEGDEVLARRTAGITEAPAGSGIYFYTFTAPDDGGTFYAVWDTGTIGPNTTTSDTVIVGYTPGGGYANEPGEPLTPLGRLYDALGVVPGDLTSDEVSKYESALLAASDAVRVWTGRSFEPQVSAERTYYYDGSGILEVDDYSELTGVAVVIPNSTDRPLTASEYGFDLGAIKDYITLGPQWGLVSRQMGFTYNLDRYEGALPGSRQIKVSALWGWATIPEGVQQAVIWTAASFSENPRPFVSESIEGYSRTVGPAPFDAIPPRALALLSPYTKIKV